jgi:hypothetical protein
VKRVAWGYTVQIDGKQVRKFNLAWTEDDPQKALAAALLNGHAENPLARVFRLGRDCTAGSSKPDRLHVHLPGAGQVHRRLREGARAPVRSPPSAPRQSRAAKAMRCSTSQPRRGAKPSRSNGPSSQRFALNGTRAGFPGGRLSPPSSDPTTVIKSGAVPSRGTTGRAWPASALAVS